MRTKITFLVVALAILASTTPAPAQQAEKVYRIGFLHPGDYTANQRIPPFLQGLRDFGYVEGRNIRIDRGSVTPMAFAVLRFTFRRNLDACWTGSSAGFAPLKILSTYCATRRYRTLGSVE